MQDYHLPTAEGVALRLETAGAGSRFAAALLDAVILLTGLLGTFVVGALVSRFDPTGVTTFFLRGLTLGSLLAFVAYHTLLPLLMAGQTPGKRSLGLRIATLDGRPPQFGACVLRSMLALVDMLPFPVPIGVIVASLSAKRQRLGDQVAGTLVVRERPQQGLSQEPWAKQSYTELQDPALELGAAAAQCLDGRDLVFLREVIGRRGLTNAARRRLFERVAAHYAERLEVTVPSDPRVLLKELYLFLRERQSQV